MSYIKSRRALLPILAYVVFMVLLAFVATQYINREALQEFVRGKGIEGLVIFGLVEYLYIIFVPIYNTTIHLAAGYIFGGQTGWILNFITTTAGLLTIILLVKKFGRPLLQKIISGNTLEKYDKIATKIGPLTLFTIYVMPFFPDDELTYIIAAANIKLKRFILPILLGNITKAAVSFIGDEGAAGFIPALGSRIVVFIIGLLLIGIQERNVIRK